MEDEQVSYDRRHGCIHCGSLTFSNEYFKAFNVRLSADEAYMRFTVTSCCQRSRSRISDSTADLCRSLSATAASRMRSSLPRYGVCQGVARDLREPAQHWVHSIYHVWLTGSSSAGQRQESVHADGWRPEKARHPLKDKPTEQVSACLLVGFRCHLAVTCGNG